MPMMNGGPKGRLALLVTAEPDDFRNFTAGRACEVVELGVFRAEGGARVVEERKSANQKYPRDKMLKSAAEVFRPG